MDLPRYFLILPVFLLILLACSQGCLRGPLGLPSPTPTPVTPAPAAQTTPTTPPTTPTPSVQTAAVGEPVTYGNLRVTVLSYRIEDTIKGDPPYTPGYQWVVLDMTVENLDPVKEVSLWPREWDPPWWITDSAGYRYQALGAAHQEHEFDGTHILPGETRRGYALSAVPKGDGGLDFIYSFGGANIAVFSLN